MKDFLAVQGKARGAVRHDAGALGGADLLAKIGLGMEAVVAFAAFGRVERNDVVALFDAGHVGAGIDDDAGAFMAQDRREGALRIGARQSEFVGVADAGRLDLDQHLAGLGPLQLDGRHLQRLAGRNGDGGAYVHDPSSQVACLPFAQAGKVRTAAQRQDRIRPLSLRRLASLR